jgi:hypothetical protein
MKIHVYLLYLTEFFLEWEVFKINVVEENKQIISFKIF